MKREIVPARRDMIVQMLNAANERLIEAKTTQQSKAVVDMAWTLEDFARRQKLGDEAIGHAHAIKVYALQKLGGMLKVTPRNKGRRGHGRGKNSLGGARVEPPKDDTPTLADLGLDKKVSSLAQQIADLPQDEVDALASKVQTINKAHVGNNAGDNEWYTPITIIESARLVMGGIDLDPATSKEARKVIKAGKICTPADGEALSVKWTKSVLVFYFVPFPPIANTRPRTLPRLVTIDF